MAGDPLRPRVNLTGSADDHAALAWNVHGTTEHERRRSLLSKLLRGVVAGWGASKLGGGCLTTILIFILLWWGLGHLQIFQ
jgi:hypothetical protein